MVKQVMRKYHDQANAKDNLPGQEDETGQNNHAESENPDDAENEKIEVKIKKPEKIHYGFFEDD